MALGTRSIEAAFLVNLLLLKENSGPMLCCSFPTLATVLVRRLYIPHGVAKMTSPCGKENTAGLLERVNQLVQQAASEGDTRRG